MIAVKVQRKKQWKGFIPVFFVYQDLELPPWEGEEKEISEALDMAKQDGFRGAYGSIVRVRWNRDSVLGQWVVFVGLGNPEEDEAIRSRRFRDSVGLLVRTLKFVQPKLLFVLPAPEKVGESAERLAQLATEGILLGAYRFERYLDESAKKKLDEHRPKEVALSLAGVSANQLSKGVSRGKILAEATIFVRDMVNEGASVVTPAYLAEQAQALAKKHKEISVKIWDEKKLQREGFGGIYAVGRGSKNPPRFIRLEYKPSGKGKKKVVLVGKGVTFDTGGVNIKSTAGIETMKEDMSGAGAILGIFSALPALKVKAHVVGLIPAAENMVDGFSYKPGDIISTYGGKTIEIINTDAEGRLILADALSYCVRHEKADEVIDLATLTGACILALGKKYVAAFFTDSTLRRHLLESGQKAGERIWEFPLDMDYKSDLKSEFASIKNAPAIRQGGTIHGALFLHHFLDGASMPWAHLDIAPAAWSRRYEGVVTYGGTGVGVRTLLEYLTSL